MSARFRFINARLIRFIGLFIVLTGVFTAVFQRYRTPFEWLVLEPVSRGAHALLTLLLPVVHLRRGPEFYDLLLPGETLRVTFGCTGIFALFILMAAVLAFPAGWRSRLRGLAWMIPVFYGYSILRIVVMGMFGAAWPESLAFVHSFLMELVNIGFILVMYGWWVEQHIPKRLARTAD